MIQGPEYIYLENPGAASSSISKVLMEEALGFRITPQYDALSEKPEKFTVFTSVRNPLTRWGFLWYALDQRNTPFVEWFEWLKNRNSPELEWLFRPQTYYIEKADKVIYFEDIYRGFKRTTFDLGYNISLPRKERAAEGFLPTDAQQLILETYREDFETLGYNGYEWVPEQVKRKPGRPPQKQT